MSAFTLPTSIRKGAAIVGTAGLLALAGCAGSTDTTAETPADTSSDTSTSADSTSGGDTTAATGSYTDGDYSADGSYQTPDGGVEQVSVTVTLADGVVTELVVTGDPQAPQSKQYQSQFIDGISDEVVGKSIDELNVSKVAGSSLTSGGFNAAIDAIKEQAAA